MENNHIGYIDTLMLTLAVEQEGFSSIKKRIKKYTFKSKYQPIKPIPFIITHECMKTDNSVLSNQVYVMITSYTLLNKEYKCSNPLNQKPTSIDECSSWTQGSKENSVIIITEFFNKKALLKTLNTLTEYKLQNMGIFL